MQKTESDIRIFLLAETFRFIDRAKVMPGVKRIALVGSLTTEKMAPRDADVLVTVDAAADLSALATAARKLKGAAQKRNKGADIFLANPDGHYIGRVCQWRKCGPGIRTSCDARHCGRRFFLHDDLDDIALDTALVKAPPVEVWPALIWRGVFPDDLMSCLTRFQASSSAS